MLKRLQNGESHPRSTNSPVSTTPVTQLIVEHGGLFPFAKALKSGTLNLAPLDTPERPMTMAVTASSSRNLVGQPQGQCVKPGDPVIAEVQGGYSHEFTTAQVHTFLQEEYGVDSRCWPQEDFAVFEDHLLYAQHNPKFVPFMHKVQTLRDLQVAFQQHTGVRDYSAVEGVSPGICHRWPEKSSSRWRFHPSNRLAHVHGR